MKLYLLWYTAINIQWKHIIHMFMSFFLTPKALPSRKATEKTKEPMNHYWHPQAVDFPWRKDTKSEKPRWVGQVHSQRIRFRWDDKPIAAQKFSHVLGQICLDSGPTLRSKTWPRNWVSDMFELTGKPGRLWTSPWYHDYNSTNSYYYAITVYITIINLYWATDI